MVNLVADELFRKKPYVWFKLSEFCPDSTSSKVSSKPWHCSGQNSRTQLGPRTSRAPESSRSLLVLAIFVFWYPQRGTKCSICHTAYTVHASKAKTLRYLLQLLGLSQCCGRCATVIYIMPRYQLHLYDCLIPDQRIPKTWPKVRQLSGTFIFTIRIAVRL